jgi:hypothetical protein
MDCALKCQPRVQMLLKCHALYVQAPGSSFTIGLFIMLLMNWKFMFVEKNMLELEHTCRNKILVKTNLLLAIKGID